MSHYGETDGGITFPAGFTAAGIHSGLKVRSKDPDIALLVSDRQATIAGVFTVCKIKAAPVKLCKERLAAGGPARAIVVNSGNANACTGDQGMRNARRMAEVAANCLRVREEEVFVCSTGTIGVPMPMDKVERGIELAAKELSVQGGAFAAQAIMTTDTVRKQAAVEMDISGRTVRIGGMTKGSGMIAPGMATTLGFMTTDANIGQRELQQCLADAVDASYNRVTVDGDMSTNYTVLCMANGAAGTGQLNGKHPQWDLFREGLKHVAVTLAKKIAGDGEGATKLVTVRVSGARSDADAVKAARAIADSLLVKTSWYGRDPNWGRILAALGYSGAELDGDSVGIAYNDVPAVRNGIAAPDIDEERLKSVLSEREFDLNVDLNLGCGTGVIYTCDISHEYVSINAEYRT